MSKVSKILVSLSFAFIVAFSFMFANLQPLFASADSISNYNVSFIAPDNSILYSTGNYVSSGSSLQGLENSNILLNSAFLENANGQSSYTATSHMTTVDDWTLFSYCTPTLNVNSDKSITITGTSTGANRYLFGQSFTNYSDYAGITLTLSFNIKSITGYIKIGINDGSSTYSSTISSSGLYSVTKTVSSSVSSSIYFLISTGSSSGSFDFTLDYAKLEIGSTFTGYYNSEYISNKLSAYNFSNYYYQYDIDTSSAITSDKYYYPNKIVSNSIDWIVKKWGVSNYGYINTGTIWTDGNNYYCSNGNVQLVLDISTSNWVTQYWNGLTNFTGMYVWTDGVNYYYSDGSFQYVLNTLTLTWNQKTWNGLTNFFGLYVWSDGTNYYYSDGNSQYVLNVSTSTWNQKTWNGLTNFSADYIWSDGTNYYYSGGGSSVQYVLDTSTATWNQKTWNGLGYFEGPWIWNDGTNYYYSNGNVQYELNVLTSTWSQKVWNGSLTNFSGTNVWYSDFGIFYSYGNSQYVFGSSLLPLDSTYYYNTGYDTGYDNGYNNGYDTGYNKGYYFGVEEAGNYTFFSLISAVIDAPLKTIIGLFNFELLGVNLFNLFTGLLTLAVLLFVIKLVLGGK